VVYFVHVAENTYTYKVFVGSLERREITSKSGRKDEGKYYCKSTSFGAHRCGLKLSDPPQSSVLY